MRVAVFIPAKFFTPPCFFPQRATGGLGVGPRLGLRRLSEGGKPIVVILHGVTGGSAETYVSHLVWPRRPKDSSASYAANRFQAKSSINTPTIRSLRHPPPSGWVTGFCRMTMWFCPEPPNGVGRKMKGTRLPHAGIFDFAIVVNFSHKFESGRPLPRREGVTDWVSNKKN